MMTRDHIVLNSTGTKKNTVLAKVLNKKSDGCSNSPDFNFYDCCSEHDWYYGKSSDLPRFIADLILAYCIYKKGHRYLSLVYFIAVRRFGKSHYEAMGDKT